MYEDSWYSFVPDFQQRRSQTAPEGPRHRRKNSLLQQPNGADGNADPQPLPSLFEDQEDTNSPPEPTLSRRAKSYSDFYDVVRAQEKKTKKEKKKQQQHRRRRHNDRNWEALALPEAVITGLFVEEEDTTHDVDLDKDLLQASQQEFLLYHDQLAMTERHLGTLIDDANSALRVLESLCQSFRAVDDQTSSFQARCDDLLTEKKRLQTLADDIGTDLHYYAYLDNVTRSLNAPGAGRLVDDEGFGEVLFNLDSCISFMTKNPSYRDAESYLARYQALLTKALHLLEVGFTNRLNKVSAEISKQIAATQSESARHALAYGRFEELLLESYSLIPNIQTIIRSVYDQFGQPVSGINYDIYINTANNIFHAYWAVRDRDLKPIIQNDLDTFKAEAKESVETASRNFVKQCFERSYNEASLFRKIFSIEPSYSTDAKSAFISLKTQQQYQRSSIITNTNVAPLAINLQSVLATSDLRTICNILGWITNEYLLIEQYDEESEPSPFVSHSRQMTALLLTEHLWPFTDSHFETEISKSIAKAAVPPEALIISPVVNNDVSSNAFPPIKRALELLLMFDQCMPKERCQRNSPTIFLLLRESIAALQRAETRIRSSKVSGTDPDLFMIKNLLLLKNELVALEIGDVRNGNPAAISTAGSVTGRLPKEMQHFGAIWDGVLKPVTGGLVAGIWSRVGSVAGYLPLPSIGMPGIPGWSRSNTPTPGAEHQRGAGAGAGEAGGAGGVDVHEQLDNELRSSIGAFTRRWAGMMLGHGNKLEGKNVAKWERDMDEVLDRAFGGGGSGGGGSMQGREVILKLKEAVAVVLEEERERERVAGLKGGK
ncbi:putative conserved oligomeric Golgi complex component 3 [Cladorrhinum sp. PSN259]|nr:putative conserved oligomeric Golgi complex component 3 [Cladorrhinum sp. PSN259]